MSAIVALMASAAEAVPYLDESLPVEERIDDALSRMTLEEKVAMLHAQSKFSASGCPRLGIPELWLSDGPHGVRHELNWDDWDYAGWSSDSCTAMPALSCLAASFNPELARKYGAVVGEEARFRKKDIMLGPGVNIYRTPLNGRNFEYMGEDPYLASRMVVPYIQGLQANGVAACLKHFVLNNQEHARDRFDVEVGERPLNELYLPAFKAGVTEGGVWAVMGSYNKFRGTHCTHNDTLVNKILKDQWNFDGVFVSDWGSTHDTREAALNGLDLEMGSWTNGFNWSSNNAYDTYYMAQPLLAMIRRGEIDESVVDDKVRRLLRLRLRTNMDRKRPWGAMNTPGHLAVAREVGREGIVLLKNENSFLPVKPGKRIAVIGENAVRKLSIGGGSSELKPRIEISPLEGLRARFGDENISFSLGYASGDPNFSIELPSKYDADSLRVAALETARNADMVLFIGGLNKNYRQDCEGDDRLSYSLPFGQDSLIADLLEVNPNVAVIIVSGNAVDMPWEEKVPAIVQSWYLGSMGGVALADILSGDFSPSGKLPFSIPRRLEDCAAHSFGERGYPGVDEQFYYDEGLLVGYRWHDTKKIPARYPFGHGLSYTTFRYYGLEADRKQYAPGDTLTVKLTVTNTGPCRGAETVQLYASQKNPRLPRPVKELKGFRKTELQPGESKEIIIRIPVSDLAYYDDTMQRWVVDDDEFSIQAGSSSTDLRAKARFRVAGSLAAR